MRKDLINLSLSIRKFNRFIVKLLVSILLMAVAFRLLSQRQLIQDPSPLLVQSPEEYVHQEYVHQEYVDFSKKHSSNGTCDIFTGEWIRNPAGPIYTNESCHVIESHQNCIMNGRPDSEYLYWRWKPRDCDIPRFNAKKFLELMTNKTWAFIGDSISRNHVQSMLCILSKVEEGYLIYHDKEWKSRKWFFPSYNFTLSVIWSPFLVEAATFEDINGVSTSEIELYLDKLDTKWEEQYQSIDNMIISGGQWWLKTAIYHENNTVVGCHYCPKRNFTEIGFYNAYRKALKVVFNYIATSKHKGLILFRSATPAHFENGEWFSGGMCNRTIPYKEGEISLNDIDVELRDIELEEFEKVASLASRNKVNFKLFDTTYLSLLRPDGHPGPYRHFYPFAKGKNVEIQNDCLHWCLPGPIDSWSDLVMELLVNN